MPYYPITYTNLLDFLIVTYIVTLVYVYKIGLRRNRIIMHKTPQFRRFLAKTGVNRVSIGSAIGARHRTRRNPSASCYAARFQSDNKDNRPRSHGVLALISNRTIRIIAIAPRTRQAPCLTPCFSCYCSDTVRPMPIA